MSTNKFSNNGQGVNSTSLAVSSRLFITLGFALALARPVVAVPFGIFDPRSLALGGAGVAAASSENAVFYNPAILATYKEFKEKGNNEAFSFPTLSIRASRALETLAEQRDSNYTQDISNSIAAYNASPTAANARAVLNSINNLNDTLGKVANNVFMLDASASLVVGIPSKYQGGAFYVSHRGVGDGQLRVPATDTQQLGNYQQVLEHLAAGEPVPVDQYTNVYDGSNLIDHSNDFTAEANARAAVISELGVSMSRQFDIMGSAFSFGITPKMVQVTSYDYHRSINNNRGDKTGTKDKDWRPNVDFGVLKMIGSQWRIGLVAKNLIERDYPVSTGQTVSFKPQWRMGVAYKMGDILYTVDMDLQRNAGVYPGNSAQYLLTGMEINHGFLRYRLGYRDTLAHTGPKEDGVFSAGLGLNFKPVYLDVAYSENHQQRAAGLMLGFNF